MAIGDGEIWTGLVNWVNDTLEGDNSDSKKGSKKTGKVYAWLEQTFDAGDKDQKGLADFAYDVTHRSGGNDATTGAAKGVELTKEEGNALFNGFTTASQVTGTALLSAFGMGGLASNINAAVDSVQVEANRSYLSNNKGSSYVSKLDKLSALIQKIGWSQFFSALELLNSSEVRTMLQQAGAPKSAYTTDFLAKFNGKVSDLYSIHPELWALPDAPKLDGWNTTASAILGGLSTIK